MFFSGYASEPNGALSWRFARKLAGTGVLADLFSHATELCQYVVGPIAEVTALTSTVYTQRPKLAMGSATHFAVIENGEMGRSEMRATQQRWSASARPPAAQEPPAPSGPPASPWAPNAATRSKSTEPKVPSNGTLSVRTSSRSAWTSNDEQGYTTVNASPRHGDYAHFQPGPGNSMGFDDLKIIEAKKFLVAVAGGAQENSNIHDAASAAAIVSAAEVPHCPDNGRRSRKSTAQLRHGSSHGDCIRPAANDLGRGRTRRRLKSLVSLVLRDSPRVSAERRQRVLEVVEELGYELNTAARSLATRSNGTIGVLVSDLHNPWAFDVVDAARPVLEEAGHTVLFSAVTASAAAGGGVDLSILQAFRDLRVAGLLVIGTVPDKAPFSRVVSGGAVVFAGGGPDYIDTADVVRSDDAHGMSMVVDHLIDQGHERIAHLGGLGGSVGAARSAATPLPWKATDSDETSTWSMRTSPRNPDTLRPTGHSAGPAGCDLLPWLASTTCSTGGDDRRR